MLTLDQAIERLRSDPRYEDLVRHAYLGANVEDSRRRFAASTEFIEVKQLLDPHITGSTVIDIGAGIGIASSALADCGAATVYALEPDRSDLVGLGAMMSLSDEKPIELLQGVAEAIPLPMNSVDIVYARQVLHHTFDLPQAMREFARILRPGGIMLACREHVVKNADELETFLKNHVVHQMAGGEHAYRLDEYHRAMEQAGLNLRQEWSTFENVINYFPNTKVGVEETKRKLLRERYGIWGRIALRLPVSRDLLLRYGDVSYPGNMYTFLATYH